MAEYTPHWLQWRKGESLSGMLGVKLLAYKHAERLGGPTVFWQVREPFFALGLPEATKLSKWYKDQARPKKLSYRGTSRRVEPARQTGDRPSKRVSI